MFENIGAKIKTLAVIVTVTGIIASLLYGFVLMITDDSLIFAGLMVIILGSLISWVGSFTLYGFGELIEQVTEMNIQTMRTNDFLKNNFKSIESRMAVQSNSEANGAQTAKSAEQTVAQNEKTTVSMYDIVKKDLQERGAIGDDRTATHMWRCSGCNQLINKSPCPYCNK